MTTDPQAEHRWLQQLVGTWRYEVAAREASGAAPVVETGTEEVRMLGGLWLLCEARNDAPADGASSVMTLGFDPARGRVVGSFVASMMAYLWVYEGALDAAAGALTLDAEGPGMHDDGRMARYRDVIALDGRERRTLTSHVLRDDGSWEAFMTMRYERVR